MDMIKISENTLDEAITKALLELQITSDHLYYEVVQKESAGLFGLFKKPCIIMARAKSDDEEKAAEKKADVKPEKKENPVRQERPVKQEKPKKTEKMPEKMPEKKDLEKEKIEEPVKVKTPIKVDEEKIQKAAKEFLSQVFGAMGMNVNIETSYDAEDGELLVSMEGDDMGILIGKRGQTLDSLQYLVSLVVNKETEGYLRVKLDTENYRERRKETLETLARNIAYKVKRTKHPVSLEPMNPYERRIIHSALQNDRYVVTRSEGEDPFRHVVISLKREGYNGGGRRDRYQNRRDNRDNRYDRPRRHYDRRQERSEEKAAEQNVETQTEN